MPFDALKRAQLEETEGWQNVIARISETPGLRFDPQWRVFVIPPFAGAVGRFIVVDGNASVSVYLDFFDALGYTGGEPYYEVYPGSDEDQQPTRFGVWESDDVIKEIRNSINRQLERDVIDPSSPDGPQAFSISDFFRE